MIPTSISKQKSLKNNNIVAGKDPIELNNERVTAEVEKRTRAARQFPACSFEEAAGLAKHLLEFGAGRPVRRISLFDNLGKSPDSGTSRRLITNSGKYGLTKGGYSAEMLELTSDGTKAVDDEQPQRERAKARMFLAIDNVPILKGYTMILLAASCLPRPH